METDFSRQIEYLCLQINFFWAYTHIILLVPHYFRDTHFIFYDNFGKRIWHQNGKQSPFWIFFQSPFDNCAVTVTGYIVNVVCHSELIKSFPYIMWLWYVRLTIATHSAALQWCKSQVKVNMHFLSPVTAPLKTVEVSGVAGHSDGVL